MQIFTLASGSTGNCTLLEDRGSLILIDLGISTKRLREAMNSLGTAPEELSGIFVTHEHNDHVCGLTTFVKHYEVPVFAPRTVANHLRWSIPGAEDYIAELSPGNENGIGAFSVMPFHTPHDTPESVGYRIRGTQTIGFCTDFGHVSDEVLEGLTGVDCAIIEANHDLRMLLDGPYPAHLKRRILSNSGHLSNLDCGELAVKLAISGTAHIILAHLSRENNTPAKALETVGDALLKNSISPGTDISLTAAPERNIHTLILGKRGSIPVALEAAKKC